MHIWYLAHPVAGDDQFTLEQNMEHTLKVLNILFYAGLNVVAPWHTMCLSLPDADLPTRERGLKIDCEMVKEMRLLILTGHRLSRGMRMELEAVQSVQGYVVDLIGVPDSELARKAIARIPTAVAP